MKTERQIALFGAKGRVGQAVSRLAKEQGIPITKVRWVETEFNQAVSNACRQLQETTGAIDIVFAGGLTDPAFGKQMLLRSNAEWPVRIIEATAFDTRFRYLTLGSVPELFAPLAAKNPYLSSKAALWQGIKTLSNNPIMKHRLVHLRGHTFYGAAPAPHSFLGQVYQSLLDGHSFSMSHGRQLREYFHFDDVSHSILALLSQPWGSCNEFNLSTGHPVYLSELAQTVFEYFNASENLHIGTITASSAENFDVKFPKSPAWLLGQPRPQIEGIINWLEILLDTAKSKNPDT